MTELARTRPESFFADRFNVTRSLLERVLGSNLMGRADDADIYLEYRVNEELQLEEGTVKKASRHVSQGAGVRALSGTRTGYAHTDDISLQNLEEAARQARAIADRAGVSGAVAVPSRGRPHDLYALAEPPLVTDLAKKLDLLRKVDGAARAADPRVKQVIASLTSEEVVTLVATASGWTVGDVRPLMRLNVTVIAEAGGKREIGAYGGGGRVAFDFFLEDGRWRRFALEAARQAVLKLGAVNAPAGTMTVVLGPGWPGILLHEAVGHGLEGDFNRKGTSAFAGRMGQKVASELVTVIDDGTIPNRRGSLNVDDEGTPTGRTVLIEKGVLRVPADAPNDQHLHVGGRGRAGADHQIGQARALCGDLRRRAGGHHEREVRFLGERGLPDRGRARDRAEIGRASCRQRSRCADARRARRSRPRARRGRWHLWQGGPVGPGGCGAPDDPHRRADRGRDGGMNIDLLIGVLKRAVATGATAADGYMIEESAFGATVRLGEVETVTHSRDQRLSLRVFAGRASAGASTSDLSRESLERVVDEATSLAKVTAEDPFAGLPDPEELITGVPDLDLADASPALSPEEKIELARRCEAAALESDPRITNSEGAECHDRRARYLYATSHGFARDYATTSFGISVAPVATRNGEMQRDYWYSNARKRSRVEDPATVGRTAATRAVRRLGARKVRTVAVPVVFDPETAASLVRSIAGAASGPSLYRRASFLLDRLGTKIASPAVTIVDDALIPAGLGSRPFDGEGLQTARTVLAREGVLESYLLDTYSARKLGMQSTHHAARDGSGVTVSTSNLMLLPGRATPSELIGSIKRGLYVTELIGFGVNNVTGDYSRGAAGLWIEDGELTYPVEEVTVAGNLLEMFQAIDAVGDDLVLRDRTAAPTLMIGRMVVAGS